LARNINRILVFLVLPVLIALSAASGLFLLNNAETDKKLKKEYFLVNQIKYGLLSGNQWVNQVNTILANRIDSFNLSPEHKKLLMEQTSAVLYKLLDEFNKTLKSDHESFKDKLRYKILNALVEVDDFRKEVPKYSAVIVNELDKTANKEKLRLLLQEKTREILSATSQDVVGEQAYYLKKYGFTEKKPFNDMVADKSEKLAQVQRLYGYLLVAILAVVLLLWLLILRNGYLLPHLFLLTVLISFITLYTSINLPMIEIDARISEMDFEILKGHIVFKDQVIFYQAKSILDVVEILLRQGKGDAILVGCLVFLFSVLFPVFKLVSTVIYLFRKEKSNKVVRYLAFNSGKWSMADVMVVAIFMAYVGFKGILDNQLGDIEMHSEQVNLITTNRTNLQVGFVTFVAFCMFNLFLSEILKKITKKELST
jgi:hypothetical protein